MIGRLVKGFLIGLVLGSIIAFGLVKGIGMNPDFALAGGPIVAYIAALATGAVVGLVAGKPVWAEGAWIEALLKTFFGALLAAGGMFLLRKFGALDVDLSKLAMGSGHGGELVAVTLPTLATLLSMFFEVDNTDVPHPTANAPKPLAGKPAVERVRAPSTSASMASARSPKPRVEEVDADDDVAMRVKRAKK